MNRLTQRAPVVGLLASFTLRAGIASSPIAGAREMTFAQARAAADRAAPDLRLASRRTDVSQAEVQIASTLSNPTVAITTARQTAKLGTSVGVPLPLFGQRGTAIHAAQADADAVRTEVEVTRREVRWKTTLAWIDLWENQSRARLLDQGVDEARGLFQIASEKFEAGAGPRLDVVRTRADLARATAEAQAVLRLASAAASRLAPWVGADPSEPIVATGEPDYPLQISPPASELAGHLPNHPTLRRDRAQASAAALHVENEQRLRWPMVTPQVTVNQSDPTLPGTDLIFGLSFELPVLSLRSGAIKRARAQEALAEETAAIDAQRLRADLFDAYGRAEGAGLKLKTLREQVLPAAQEAREMTIEGYRSGRIDLLRLLDAQRAFLDSRLAELDAAASWARAVADLENAEAD